MQVPWGHQGGCTRPPWTTPPPQPPDPTMLDSFLVQVRVSGGLPDHTHVSVTSEPMSVMVGLGSTTIRGATGEWGEEEGEKQSLGGAWQQQLGDVGEGAAPLTVHVHQRADVGAANVVVHLAGDRLREESVIHLCVVLVLLGILNDHPSLGPPGGGAETQGGHVQGTPRAPFDPPYLHMMLNPSQEVGGGPPGVLWDPHL